MILVGKFMTRKALSIEVVGRTLKPLWKTRNGFEIRDVGNHILLFVFDNENEAERVLQLNRGCMINILLFFLVMMGPALFRKLDFILSNYGFKSMAS